MKKSVSLKGLTPQMCLATLVVSSVLQDKYEVPCVLTSGNDGSHGYGSLHFSGGALDYRTKNLPSWASVDGFKLAVEENLSDEYDTVISNLGEPDECLHVEYQPKR